MTSNSYPFQLFPQVLDHMRPIEGWFPEDEASLLFAITCRALAESSGPRSLVEIGSYCGRSTVVLGGAIQAAKSEAKVYAIDPHAGALTLHNRSNTFRPPTLEKLTRNIAAAGLQDSVLLIQQLSYEVFWDKPITLLFIDGLHDYINVSRDFKHSEGWIRDGGYCAFHDYSTLFPDVISFVDEVLLTRKYIEMDRLGSLIILQKQP